MTSIPIVLEDRNNYYIVTIITNKSYLMTTTVVTFGSESYF